MSKKKQIGYSLIVWETLKEYNEETKWYEPTKNKRVEVAQLLSEELSDNEDVKSMLLDELFGYKDNIKEMLKNNEFTEIPDYHKKELEKDKTIADLEAKLAESENKHLLAETEWQDYCAFKHIEPQIKGCLDREREYKNQLAKEQKHISRLKNMNKSHDEAVGRLTEENNQLKQQLAEKEGKIETLKQRIDSIVKIYSDDFVSKDTELKELRHKVKQHNQDKISFAVEQLIETKEFADKQFNLDTCNLALARVLDKILYQIKAIKEME